MAATPKADPRMEHRLRSPNIPLVVQAVPFTRETDRDSSGNMTDDGTIEGSTVSDNSRVASRADSPTPTVRLATLLEQEHKINRLQAEELSDAHNIIVKLKREVEAIGGAANNSSSTSSPRRQQHRHKSSSHEIVRLVADNNDLAEALTETRKAQELKDRQIAELERQLHDMSDRLHSALQSLKTAHTHKEDESYLVPLPDVEINPLAAAVDAFKNMSVVELAEANMALSHYLAKSRARVSPSAPFLDFTNPRTSPKRPASPFPSMRPISTYAGIRQKNQNAVANEDDRSPPRPPPSRASQRFASNGSSDSPPKLSTKKAVRYKSGLPEPEKGGKKSKGLFGISGLFSRK